MREQNNKIEKDYLSKIDCNFPYADISLRDDLINQAFEISSNSVFAIIEELARIPKSEKENISAAAVLKILEPINLRFKHPLKEIVVNTAVKMICNKKQSVNEALVIMNEIESYTGEWSALNIIYFSCDDVEGKVDVKYDEIKDKWMRNKDIS